MSLEGDSRFERAAITRAERHLFLCLGPDCCNPQEGERVWEHLKREVKSLNLPVLRTKAACFRVCTGGPWLVIYPEGIWYGEMTPERCDRILKEHLQENRPVQEWIAIEHPLSRE